MAFVPIPWNSLPVQRLIVFRSPPINWYGAVVYGIHVRTIKDVVGMRHLIFVAGHEGTFVDELWSKRTQRVLRAAAPAPVVAYGDDATEALVQALAQAKTQLWQIRVAERTLEEAVAHAYTGDRVRFLRSPRGTLCEGTRRAGAVRMLVAKFLLHRGSGTASAVYTIETSPAATPGAGAGPDDADPEMAPASAG